jgi:uncharacterized protein YceK
MKKSLLLLCAVVMLSGCVTHMCPTSSSSGSFESADYYCKMKTRSGSPEMLLVDRDHYIECMRIEKGFVPCR